MSSLSATLEATGLSATSLELELTEGILMNDTDAAIDTLHALREMGISVAIDDFGTGFSSLSYLRHLPVDKVKLTAVLSTILPIIVRMPLLFRALWHLLTTWS
ncbi:hypothetical protein HORIV_43730 [Vreelandella olivaria]|uniref:EAL domain-containing protein n=1 Tax=Vreelandella olivaria TaxID=390919 RepID=A0ABN5X1J4_9GAMM|nr:hypothetical protein HORIV_43730 [Halomonas olivaria]